MKKTCFAVLVFGIFVGLLTLLAFFPNQASSQDPICNGDFEQETVCWIVPTGTGVPFFVDFPTEPGHGKVADLYSQGAAMQQELNYAFSATLSYEIAINYSIGMPTAFAYNYDTAQITWRVFGWNAATSHWRLVTNCWHVGQASGAPGSWLEQTDTCVATGYDQYMIGLRHENIPTHRVLLDDVSISIVEN